MAEKNVLKNVRIALKRGDTAYFEPIKDTFIPLYGEVVIIDTDDGIRTKIGDGKTCFANLPFTDENLRSMASGAIVRGYYFENKFYQDPDHKISIVGYEWKIYIDIPTREIYGFFESENRFSEINSVNAPTASNTVSGVSKLYSSLGQNADGSIDQRTVTNEINKKFTISLDYDEGLIFKDGIEGNEV